ncbi:hypothetical protein DFH28DRAFT_955230 [Melampsora americana]|nr:hypothetical protein DFH28DRAFT_955230 [Melampsora americana]
MNHSKHFIEIGSSNRSLESDRTLSLREYSFKSNSVNQPSEPDLKQTTSNSTERSSYFSKQNDDDVLLKEKKIKNEGFKSMISDAKKFKLDLSFNRKENLNDQLECQSPKSLNSNPTRDLSNFSNKNQSTHSPLPLPLPSPSIKDEQLMNSKELKKVYSKWRFPIRTDSVRGLTWGPFKDENLDCLIKTRSQTRKGNRKIYVILRALETDQVQDLEGVEEREVQETVEIQKMDSELIERRDHLIPSIKFIDEENPSKEFEHQTLRTRKSKRELEIEFEQQEIKSNHQKKRIKSNHELKEVEWKIKESNLNPSCSDDYLFYFNSIQFIQPDYQFIPTQDLIEVKS